MARDSIVPEDFLSRLLGVQGEGDCSGMAELDDDLVHFSVETVPTFCTFEEQPRTVSASFQISVPSEPLQSGDMARGDLDTG